MKDFVPYSQQESYWISTVQGSLWRSSLIWTMILFSGMHLLGLTWLHRHQPHWFWPLVIADFLLLTMSWARALAVRRHAAEQLAAATSAMEKHAILRSTCREFRVWQLTVGIVGVLLQSTPLIWS